MASPQSHDLDTHPVGNRMPSHLLAPLLRDLAMRDNGRFAILASAEPDLPLGRIASGDAFVALARHRFTRIYGTAAILLAEAIGREPPVAVAARRDVIAMLVTALAPSATLREAVGRIAQFNAAIAQNGIGITLSQDGDGDRLVIDLRATLRDPPVSLTTVSLIFVVNVLTWLGEMKPEIVAIGLAHGAATATANDPCLAALNIPVLHGCHETYLQFAPGALDKNVHARPLPAADIMELIAHDPLFSVRQNAPTSSRVKAFFLECETARAPIPDRIATAERLQISPSTLHRQLKGEGTSFLSLRAAWQRQIAEYLLGQGILNVPAIAQRTGFHDGRTFRRAFIGWTGQRPSEFRKRK